MFEDSTFESTGKIRTRSRAWMFATLLLDAAILIVLILVPLIYPEALPRMTLVFLMTAPPPTPPAPPAPRPVVRSSPVATEMPDGRIAAPRQIPRDIFVASAPEPEAIANLATMDMGSGASNNPGDAFHGQSAGRVVRAAPSTPVRISSGVAASIALRKDLPVYPAIAKAAGVEGTVTLAATISKSGSVENLRVVSGSAMLQQAALDAVKNWRYRPYLLNGDPVEVETTVNVVFHLQR
jgi:periplasmic protein TonB